MDGSAETLLLFYTPAFLVENKEILVMSIPGALSTWGGIIPIIGSIFYFFFGKGKLSPFGFLHKGILRSSINTKIDSIYRKNKGDDDDDDVLDQDHQSAAAHVFPNEKSCHNVDPSDISAVQVLGPKEEQQQVEEATEASLRKQLQHQQDELTSLRAFVQTQGDILKRLQKNELQSRNMMSLVKEFYLEMGLVDTDSIDLDNSPPVDTPNHNTTQSRSWLQGLFKSTESNKQD
ncbi:hypothetical protein B0O80DRAFT_268216 [Mortierella sp. GBAus27b]|nr:hypothetical protein B0O80DRAFT_268216 [Mortierella sp. GBAus27b]